MMLVEDGRKTTELHNLGDVASGNCVKIMGYPERYLVTDRLNDGNSQRGLVDICDGTFGFFSKSISCEILEAKVVLVLGGE